METNESKFTGGLLGLIGVNIVSFLIIGLTLGLCTPAAICYRERWYAKHTYINGRQLVFKGKGIQLFGQYIKWFFLCIITLGIYSFWLSIKMKQWIVAHTFFADEKVDKISSNKQSARDLIDNDDAKFAIALTDIGTKDSTKIEIIKIVREDTGCGLAEAKSRVENMDIVQKAFTEKEAERLVDRLEDAGATAEIRYL